MSVDAPYPWIAPTIIAFALLPGSGGQDEGQAALRDLPADEALSVIEMLAKQTLENYSRLVSFEAEYAIEDKSIVREDKLRALRYDVPEVPGPWRERDTGIVKLRFDAVKDSIFSEIEMHQCVLDQDANGQSMDHALPLTEAQRAIVTPSHFYYFRYNSRYGDFREIPAISGKVGRVAMRKPLEEADRQAHATVVDPRDFFGYSDFFWNDLERIADVLRKDREGNLTKPAGVTDPVVRVQSFGEGGGQEYRVAVTLWRSTEGKGTGRIRLVLRFAKNVGYNCTSVGVVGEQGADVEMNGWVYTVIKGIFVPSKMSRVLLDPTNGRPTNGRVLVLNSCKVNEGIEEADLGLPALGLRNGERVMDYVDEVCYEYKDGKLDNPVSFGALPPSRNGELAPTAWPWRSITVVVNVVLLLLLLVGMFIRRQYHKRRSLA
jgi:hypothetical protein